MLVCRAGCLAAARCCHVQVWVGVITAYLFTYIPEWTSWVLLALMAIYDLAAVLMPGGPLKVGARMYWQAVGEEAEAGRSGQGGGGGGGVNIGPNNPAGANGAV